jgi:hypothetical protein
VRSLHTLNCLSDESHNRSLRDLEVVIESGDKHLLSLAMMLTSGHTASIKAVMLRQGVTPRMIEVFEQFNNGLIDVIHMRARCLEELFAVHDEN